MTNLEPIIYINKSGNVKVSDCIIITKKGRITLLQESTGHNHQFNNIYFITKKPKWWQIRKWINFIKTIYKAL